MLSRIAESLYWIGRYVERAEDTARLLDVHYHLLLEDRRADEAAVCRALLEAMGVEPGRDRPRTRRRHGDRAPRAGPVVLGLDRVLHRRGLGERARRARGHLLRDVAELNTMRREVGQPRPGGAGPGPPRLLPLGARPRRACYGHRRRHDESRRRLALPRARAEPRTRRHDRAAAVGALRRRVRTDRVDDDAADLRGPRGVPADAITTRSTLRARSSSCSSTGCSLARCTTR